MRPAHLYQYLEAVHCGSFFGGQFMSHFSRTPFSGTPAEEKFCLASIQLIRSCDTITDLMFVDFEHDRDFFAVRFAISEPFPPKNNVNQENGKVRYTPVSIVTMKVRYVAIRRVLVDLRAIWPGPGYLRRIYFHLNFPPEIRR
ncbi:unnamed protein product [Gongylonema pulchrum]|uniref:PH-like domain-containing protein n=1 Tax=Gongylonema pulchrum TaxID=637853 RepID=A0A183DNZ5_9BILA|nr:unnamed protein product [Gongylonema pulchrum]